MKLKAKTPYRCRNAFVTVSTHHTAVSMQRAVSVGLYDWVIILGYSDCYS